MPQDWFDQFVPKPPAAPGPVRQQPADDWFAQVSTPQPESVKAPAAPARTWWDSAGDFLKEAAASLNPKTINTAVQSVNPITYNPESGVWTPADTFMRIGEAQGHLAQKAKAAYDKGDYTTAARHALNYMIPLLGGRIDEAGDMMSRGEYARGLGATVDVAGQVAGPAAIGQARNLRVPTGARVPITAGNRNAAEAAVVAFAEREGIPVDAATASGSPFVKRVQKRASDTLGGAGVAEEFRRGQTERLATVGEQLAAKGYPQGVVTPETAGQGLRDAALGKVREYADAANTEYGKLRDFEADPRYTRPMQVGVSETPTATGVMTEPIMQDVALGVDLRGVKEALTPLYNQLRREAQLVPLMGDKGRALTALDRLVGGPDAASLSVVDGALSDLKAMARSDIPELRTVGQGVAAGAVKKLHAEVDAAAKAAGPDVFDALQSGREATKAKVFAGDLLETIQAEPVEAFRNVTLKQDAGIARLRKLDALVPDEMPKIGRAWLDKLMERATAEGGFSRADGLLREWQNLGPQTKQVLFRDADYIKDLDNFFLLAKKVAENPNPSGTATTLTALNLGSAPVMYTLSKLLYSPKGASLAARGLAFQFGKPNGVINVPLGSKAAKAAVEAEILKLVGEQSTVRYPRAANQEGRRP